MSLENGLFIFRRDLRIEDNNGLNLLSMYCKNIYTIFIFTPEQVGSGNKYKSDNAVQFMIESLADLDHQIRKAGGELKTFFGHNEKVILDCIKAWNIDMVTFNLDVTPYARERDAKISNLCEKTSVYIIYAHDYYLCKPDDVRNGSGEAYQKFTPYYEKAKKMSVQKPMTKKIHFKSSMKSVSNTITLSLAMKKFTKVNPDILVHGGRENAIKQLRIASKNIEHYANTHNDLNKPTSQLSSYIKFGCLSIRETYYKFKSNHEFIRQLYWRDFYANILYEFPKVLGKSLKPKYDKIKWHYNTKWFNAWCKGQTGFAIVDAGMRQMNKTGYMHNRARLIVSSFLVKTLLIDWREGEKYFAQTLTDYDVANNNGNWQWISSVGADSQPFFRIFNPWRQGEEWDPKCEYIKQWVPELSSLDPKMIHNWSIEYEKYKDIKYPKPICNYEEQREKALKMYKNA